MNNAHVVLADDHPLFIYAMQEKLSHAMVSLQIDCARNYQELFRLVQRLEQDLDLVILDLNMPGSNGLEGLNYLVSQFPSVPVLVVSGQDDIDNRQTCLEAGAAEFISKSEEENVLVELVCKLVYGAHPVFEVGHSGQHEPSENLLQTLTPSQLKVLRFLADGLSNKHIARELEISEKTVRVHASAIFKHLGVKNRTQAAVLFKNSRMTETKKEP